jgi:heterogeneous nuclear ribonucleoprotein A1/A3
MTEQARQLFIGNIKFDTTEDDLRKVFGTFGDIDEIKIPVDRATRRPRGFAFVRFVTHEAANEACRDLDGKDLNGRPMRVGFAQEKARDGEGGGGSRGGEGRSGGGMGGGRSSFGGGAGGRSGGSSGGFRSGGNQGGGNRGGWGGGHSSGGGRGGDRGH